MEAPSTSKKETFKGQKVLKVRKVGGYKGLSKFTGLNLTLPSVFTRANNIKRGDELLVSWEDETLTITVYMRR